MSAEASETPAPVGPEAAHPVAAAILSAEPFVPPAEQPSGRTPRPQSRRRVTGESQGRASARSSTHSSAPQPPAGAEPASTVATDPRARDAAESFGEPDDGERPSALHAEEVDAAIVRECAALDHSDTDNAERLIRHFGRDLSVLAQEGVPVGDWLAWTGTHWDQAGGAARVRLVAQKLGARIGLEAGHLTYTEAEQAAIDAAPDLDTWWPDVGDAPKPDQRRLKAAARARQGLEKRRRGRHAHAVTSKNHARMEKALECAGPRLRRQADEFNPDRFVVACQTHTLRFRRELDPDCPDPDVTRWMSSVSAEPEHRREDWVTAVMPVQWRGRDAPAKKWRAFLAEMMPDAEKLRTVQQFTGVSLLGIPMQYLMFHYGSGANGKSIFLETISRVLGPGLAVGLPRESIVGGSDRGSGSASPDLARMFGKRFVRILEVKADVPLQEDLIKKLTGGEAFPVRSLFKGYFEFQSIAKPHMSGNGFPTIDGTDNGIWRRMLVVHWEQVVAEEKKRDFEEMVAEIVGEESSGILAWLVDGALDYLANGLVIASSIREATRDYRGEMDPIGEFLAACVRPVTGGRVQALALYEAYVSWSLANAKRARSNTKFGRVVSQRHAKAELGGRLWYVDCELHDVPERPLGHPASPVGS